MGPTAAFAPRGLRCIPPRSELAGRGRDRHARRRCWPQFAQAEQAVFHNGECVASGELTVVLTHATTRRSKPFSEEARAFLEGE